MPKIEIVWAQNTVYVPLALYTTIYDQNSRCSISYYQHHLTMSTLHKHIVLPQGLKKPWYYRSRLSVIIIREFWSSIWKQTMRLWIGKQSLLITGISCVEKNGLLSNVCRCRLKRPKNILTLLVGILTSHRVEPWMSHRKIWSETIGNAKKHN